MLKKYFAIAFAVEENNMCVYSARNPTDNDSEEINDIEIWNMHWIFTGLWHTVIQV